MFGANPAGVAWSDTQPEKREECEKETEIKRISGSFLISQWKQEKQKLNEM